MIKDYIMNNRALTKLKKNSDRPTKPVTRFLCNSSPQNVVHFSDVIWISLLTFEEGGSMY